MKLLLSSVSLGCFIYVSRYFDSLFIDVSDSVDFTSPLHIGLETKSGRCVDKLQVEWRVRGLLNCPIGTTLHWWHIAKEIPSNSVTFSVRGPVNCPANIGASMLN